MPTRKNPKTARQILDAMIEESQLQKDVIDLAHKLGFLANHNYDSRRSGPDKGLPDLILAGQGRALFIELKKENGRTSKAQLEWHHRLMDAGIESFIWRPSHWSSGLIERVLTQHLQQSAQVA